VADDRGAPGAQPARPRRPSRRAVAWLAALAVLAALRWFDVHPIPLREDAAPARGAVVWRAGSGPVALLARDDRPAPVSFTGETWDWAWLHVLEREFGPTDVLDAAAPPPEPLPEWRGVVVGAGAARTLTNEWSSALARYATQGGRVLVDGGYAPEALLPGARADSALFRWRDLADGETASALEGLAPDGDILRAWTFGSGRVTLAAPCLSRLLQAIEQGRPSEDLRLFEQKGHPDLLTPVDMSSLPPSLAEVPVSDILGRSVIRAAFGGQALFGFWHVPEARAGAFLPSHDEEGFGDHTLFEADYEREAGVRSTFFIIPGAMTDAAMVSLCADGFEIGLHWDRGYPEPRWVRLGVWKFRPFRRAMALEDQLDALAGTRAGGCDIRGNRNHGLLWTAEYTGVLDRLEAARFDYDSSYGPDGDRYGYVFGTGLPFRPVGGTGRPLSIIEIPFLFQDDECFEASSLPAFLSGSRDSLHEFIGVIFHPTTMGYRPSVAGFEAWLASYGQARDRDHWVGTMGEIVSFWRNRLAGRIAPARPARDGASPGSPGETVDVDVEAKGEGQALWVTPAGASVWVDGRARRPAAVFKLAGALERAALYDLAPGPHRLRIVERARATPGSGAGSPAIHPSAR
jgi:hypothetical protein